jgi:hypothetical protein
MPDAKSLVSKPSSNSHRRPSAWETVGMVNETPYVAVQQSTPWTVDANVSDAVFTAVNLNAFTTIGSYFHI